jgi:hypothetical protein
VLDAGRRYLGLDWVRHLTVEVGDARVALARSEERFHAIVVDVFRGMYVPATS